MSKRGIRGKGLVGGEVVALKKGFSISAEEAVGVVGVRSSWGERSWGPAEFGIGRWVRTPTEPKLGKETTVLADGEGNVKVNKAGDASRRIPRLTALGRKGMILSNVLAQGCG